MEPMIGYRNLWAVGEIYGVSSEHPQAPAEGTQESTREFPWQTRHGVGTGNGRFVITGAGNIVPNGSFTTDATGWTAGHCTLASVAGGVLSNCLEITRVDSGGQDAYQNVPGFTIGAAYTLSVYVKSGTSGNEAAGIQVWDYTLGANVVSNFAITSSATWTRYVLTFTAPQTSLRIILRKNSITAGTMLFDEVLVVENTGNNKIDFQIGSDYFMAALTAGTYNGQTLAAEVVTRMNAASGATFTCVYDDAAAKFTPARAAGNFSLLWNTGAHAAYDASGPMGFSAAADKTGAATYTSDVMVCHTSEYLYNDLGSAQEYDFVGILGHNLTTSAALSLIGADDDAFATGLVTDVLTYVGNNIWQILGTARTKRYVGVVIVDPANPDGYIEVGPVALYKGVTLNRGMAQGYGRGSEDPSAIEVTPAGVTVVTDRRKPVKLWDVAFPGLSDASEVAVLDLLEVIGYRPAWAICQDPTAPNASTYWGRIREGSLIIHGTPDYNDWAFVFEEVN